jgi:hypothetical protein
MRLKTLHEDTRVIRGASTYQYGVDVRIYDFSDGAKLVIIDSCFKCRDFQRPVPAADKVLVKDGVAYTGPDALLKHYKEVLDVFRGETWSPPSASTAMGHADYEVLLLALKELTDEGLLSYSRLARGVTKILQQRSDMRLKTLHEDADLKVVRFARSTEAFARSTEGSCTPPRGSVVAFVVRFSDGVRLIFATNYCDPRGDPPLALVKDGLALTGPKSVILRYLGVWTSLITRRSIQQLMDRSDYEALSLAYEEWMDEERIPQNMIKGLANIISRYQRS